MQAISAKTGISSLGQLEIDDKDLVMRISKKPGAIVLSFHRNSKMASARGGFDSFRSTMSSLNVRSVKFRLIRVKSFRRS